MHPAGRRNFAESGKYSWGTTRDEEGAGRRVFVNNVPPGTTVDDLKGLFGPVENIEGIEVKNHYAFVQFKRPIAYTRALAKNQLNFNGKQLRVRPYHNDLPADSRRGRIRSGARSASGREQSRSPDDEEAEFEASLRDNHELFQDDAPPDYDVSMSDMRRQMFNDASQDFQEHLKRSAPKQEVSLNATGVTEDLPRNVALLLELVIEQKTASNLSLDQVRSIFEYFQTSYSRIQQSQSFQRCPVSSVPQTQPVQVRPATSTLAQARVEPLGPAPMRPIQTTTSDRLYSESAAPEQPDENNQQTFASRAQDPNFQAAVRTLAKVFGKK